jgi:uncharacterized protein
MTFATDRATEDRATFAAEQIGRTRHRTPEGYLLCEGVRLARVGPMIYAPSEMPDVEPGSNSMIVIERGPEALFDADSMLSYSGKAVTNDHPPSPVVPLNFKNYAVGTVLHPRQGEGVEADYLIGDLLIMEQDAIEAVEAGKLEVSCGYDCEVEQIKPGLGRVTKIVGNHVALVKRGRAGPACAIQDKEPVMAKRKRTIIDRLRTAFKANDEAAFEEELTNAEDELEGDEPQKVVIELKGPDAPAASDEEIEENKDEAPEGDDRLATLEATVAQLVEAVGKIVKAEQAEAAEMTGDGESEEEKTEAADEEEEEVEKKTAMDALAKAEVLAPGIKLPTFDGARVKGQAITALRRQALRKAYDNAATRPHIVSVLGGRQPTFDKMPATLVGVLFDGASALVAAANNHSATRHRPADIPQGRMTADKLQQLNVDRRKAAH